MSSHPQFANMILARLPREDLDRLMPHLEPFALELRYKVAEINRPIEHIHFVESGIVSVVASVRNDIPVEVGIVGREGVANLPALMGMGRSQNDCLAQVPGRSLRLAVEHGRSAMDRSPAFNLVIRQYAHLFMAQTSSTILANTRGAVSQRLARWLLMVRDRVDDDAMPLTHEFISSMLGVRRPGVTIALRSFEDAGWISRSRGMITLLDRDALITEADGFYGAAEQELIRFYGTKPGT